jgi:WD40 repeat protein
LIARLRSQPEESVKLPLTLVALSISTYFATANEPDLPAKLNDKDVYDAPLPAGAKLRLGTTRLTFPHRSPCTPLPPDYKQLLVADAQGAIRRYEIATGRPVDLPVSDRKQYAPVTISSNGKRTLERGNPLIVRDTATGKKVAELSWPGGFQQAVQRAAEFVFSADGKFLALGGLECWEEGEPGRFTFRKTGKGMVAVWDVEKQQIVMIAHTIQNLWSAPALSPDGKILATFGWNSVFAAPANGATVIPAEAPGLYRPSNKPKILTVGSDPSHTVQVWNVETGKELCKAQATCSGQGIVAAVFSPDGNLLAFSAGSGPIDLWDVKTGKQLHTLLGQSGQGQYLAFSPDSKVIASANHNGTVQQWATADGRLLATSKAPVLPAGLGMDGLAFTNTRAIAWGTVNRATVVWEVSSGKLLTPEAGYVGGIRSIGFRASGKEIVTSDWDHVIRWDAVTGKLLGTVALPEPENRANRPNYTVSADATRAVDGFPSAIYDLSTGEEMFAIPLAPTLGGALHMTVKIHSDDMRWIVVLSRPINEDEFGGACVVWDTLKRRKVTELQLPLFSADGNIALSPSGTRLVTTSRAIPTDQQRRSDSRQVITGWDLKTGKKLAELEDKNNHGDIVGANETAAILSNGTQLWVVDFERGVKGEEIGALPMGQFTGKAVFSPDGKMFAIATDKPGEYGIRVYDWPRGRLLHTFAGHTEPVSTLQFSPDGKVLASGSQDTTVLLWDLTAK